MKLLHIALLLLITLVVMPACASNATNWSVSDLGYTGPQTIQVYSQGILLGTYNTTSNAIPVPEHDFLVVIKPEVKNQFADMNLFLSTVIGVATSNAVPLVFIVFLIGLFWFGRK